MGKPADIVGGLNDICIEKVEVGSVCEVDGSLKPHDYKALSVPNAIVECGGKRIVRRPLKMSTVWDAIIAINHLTFNSQTVCLVSQDGVL